MTWPTDGVDAAVVRSNGEIADADDFNNQDTQIRGIQTWLGDGDGELIGDDSNPAHGPGGLSSPVADGGDAIVLASKSLYTSGTLVSVVNGRDQNPREVFSVDYEGYIDAEGVSVDADGVLADPGVRNKVQTVTSSSGEIDVNCQDGLTVAHTLTEDTEVQEPTNAENGMCLTFIFRGSGSNKDVDFALLSAGGFGGTTSFPVEVSSSEALIIEFQYDSTLDMWLEKYSNLCTVAAV